MKGSFTTNLSFFLVFHSNGPISALTHLSLPHQRVVQGLFWSWYMSFPVLVVCHAANQVRWLVIGVSGERNGQEEFGLLAGLQVSTCFSTCFLTESYHTWLLPKILEPLSYRYELICLVDWWQGFLCSINMFFLIAVTIHETDKQA